MTIQSSHSSTQEETMQKVENQEMQREQPRQENRPAEKDNRNGRQKSLRGFAAMDEGKQRAIASMGGRAAHQQGVAHEFTSDEARQAGRKGGEAVSQNREHMAAIGKKGGEAAHGRRRQRQPSEMEHQSSE